MFIHIVSRQRCPFRGREITRNQTFLLAQKVFSTHFLIVHEINYLKIWLKGHRSHWPVAVLVTSGLFGTLSYALLRWESHHGSERHPYSCVCIIALFRGLWCHPPPIFWCLPYTQGHELSLRYFVSNLKRTMKESMPRWGVELWVSQRRNFIQLFLKDFDMALYNGCEI